MYSNSTETRQIDGYIRKWTEHGKSRIEVKCPFCSAHLIAYVWSLNGSGKKCSCGAKMDGTGTFTKNHSK